MINLIIIPNRFNDQEETDKLLPNIKKAILETVEKEPNTIVRFSHDPTFFEDLGMWCIENRVRFRSLYTENKTQTLTRYADSENPFPLSKAKWKDDSQYGILEYIDGNYEEHRWWEKGYSLLLSAFSACRHSLRAIL